MPLSAITHSKRRNHHTPKYILSHKSQEILKFHPSAVLIFLFCLRYQTVLYRLNLNFIPTPLTP